MPFSSLRLLTLAVLALAPLGPVAGCADDQTVDPNGCKDPNAIARAELVATSVETLRKYYGTLDGFDGGELYFQEVVVEPEADCAFEDTYVAYRVALPEAFRPRPHDDEVAVSWGLDGTLNIFALNVDNDSVYVEGQNPLSAIINFKEDAIQADVEAYLSQLQSDYPMASIIPLGGGPGGPGGPGLPGSPSAGSPSAISVVFGRSKAGYDNPALVQAALAVQHGAHDRSDVEHVNLESYGFFKGSFRGSVTRLEGEMVHLECLRNKTLERPIKTLTSLPIPMGLGRHYNLEECPIQDWPAECEYEASEACKEAMANL